MAENCESVPQNLKKDGRCIYSVNITPTKQDTNRKSNFNKDTGITRSPRLSHRSSLQTNRKTLSRAARDDRTSGDKFIDLS